MTLLPLLAAGAAGTLASFHSLPAHVRRATIDSVTTAAVSAPAAPPCFRGRPLPRCGRFWITEAGVYTPFAVNEASYAGLPPRRRLNPHVAWEVGQMVNVDARSAVGGTLLVGADGRGHRLGAKVRYRRWLTPSATLDVSGGPLTAGMAVTSDRRSGARAYGATSDASVGWRDVAAVTIRVEALRGAGQTGAAAYGGVRLGSGTALAGTVAAVAYATLFILSLAAAAG